MVKMVQTLYPIQCNITNTSEYEKKKRKKKLLLRYVQHAPQCGCFKRDNIIASVICVPLEVFSSDNTVLIVFQFSLRRRMQTMRKSFMCISHLLSCIVQEAGSLNPIHHGNQKATFNAYNNQTCNAVNHFAYHYRQFCGNEAAFNGIPKKPQYHQSIHAH